MSASSHLPTTRAYDRAPRPGSGIAHWIAGWIADIGATLIEWVCGMGSLAIFSLATFRWLFGRLPRKETVLANFYQIGVRSLPVMVVTGTFIGMVLAVQSYDQFHKMGLESSLGAMINWSLVRELGPVLAATMLAGCLVLIPSLTIMADFTGIFGGYLYSVCILGINGSHYNNSARLVGMFDLFSGVFKSLFFGAAIALIGCHRGFHCDPGAEGVGRAATDAFVYSFVVILLLDLLLNIALVGIHTAFFPDGSGLF
jgi:phospholipid/cholesterol/gamma-HCH transport system permease protein